MKRIISLTIAALLAPGCSGGQDADALPNGAANTAAGDQGSADAVAAGTRWDLQSSGEGVALALLRGPEESVVRLFCPGGGGQLLVNVPVFRPVGSEERMTFGSNGDVATIVADSRGDRQRGGVTGAGEVPANLAQLIAGPLAVNYGSQNSGPHSAPPAQAARAFVAACLGSAVERGVDPAAPAPAPAPAPADLGACRMQDGKTLPPNRLRAIGTEPFWGARIEGRCVTYSHPENQAGTRIWAQFSGTAEAGSWIGFYENQRFVLRTRPEPGCSDGMSDNRYPIAVTLDVAGERRTGCARPN